MKSKPWSVALVMAIAVMALAALNVPGARAQSSTETPTTCTCDLTGVTSNNGATITYCFAGALSDPFGTLAAGTPFKGWFSYGYPQSDFNPIGPPDTGEYHYNFFSLTIGSTTVTDNGTDGLIVVYDYPTTPYPTDLFILYAHNLVGSLGGLTLAPVNGILLELEDPTGTAWTSTALPGAGLTLADVPNSFILLQSTPTGFPSVHARGPLLPCPTTPTPTPTPTPTFTPTHTPTPTPTATETPTTCTCDGLAGVTNGATITYCFAGALSDPFGTLAAGTPFKGWFSYGYPQSDFNPITPPDTGEYYYNFISLTFPGNQTVTVNGPMDIVVYDNFTTPYSTDLFVLYTFNVSGSLGGLTLLPSNGIILVLEDVTGTAWSSTALPGAGLTLANVANSFIQLQSTQTGFPPPNDLCAGPASPVHPHPNADTNTDANLYADANAYTYANPYGVNGYI